MKKIISLICAVCITLMFTSCQKSDPKDLQPLLDDIFKNRIVISKDSFSIKNIPWGATEKEIVKNSSEELKVEKDRLISSTKIVNDIEYVTIYNIEDQYHIGFVSFAASFRCKSEESFKKLLEKLYEHTNASLPPETAMGKSNEHYTSWKANDNSYVRLLIADNLDQFAVSIQVTMPRPDIKG